MITPGADAQGTASSSGEYALITGTASDTWGGVQSPEFSLDFSKNPVCVIETGAAAPKWGARFVPSTKAAGDNGWGFVLLGDDDDNTAGSHTYGNMGKVNIPGANDNKSFSTLYPGPSVEGRLWIYAAGRNNATVEIKTIKIYYPDEVSNEE
ncbi:hypothetical protein AGMMS4952_20360 [Spirochaetia bacterium]|nr:hypothetical protein AGMMS4952_20360 [Spirochaetia bacterium]